MSTKSISNGVFAYMKDSVRGQAVILASPCISRRNTNYLFSNLLKGSVRFVFFMMRVHLDTGRRIIIPSSIQDAYPTLEKAVEDKGSIFVKSVKFIINNLTKETKGLWKPGSAYSERIEALKFAGFHKSITKEILKTVVGDDPEAIFITREFNYFASRTTPPGHYNTKSFMNVVGMEKDEKDNEVEPGPVEEDKNKIDTSIPSDYKKIGDVYVKVEQLNAITAAASIPLMNVLAVGESGYGKTSLPRAYAQENGLTYLRVNCSAVRDPLEWFGYMEARDGSTVFEKTRLSEVLEAGNAVIVLDEFNRVEPWIANPMMQIMDFEGVTHVHGIDIKRGENVLFFGTANIGSSFTGTFAMDAAMQNRFGVKVKVLPVPVSVETVILNERTGLDKTICHKIASMMDRLRSLKVSYRDNTDISTRTALNIAKLVHGGISIQAAVNVTILSMLDGASPLRKDIIDALRLEGI